jgi:predicted outer membrane repeat protein
MGGTAKISDNQAILTGGGVHLQAGNFTMHSGSISGNNAGNQGGGVYFSGNNCTMYNGSISGNSATGHGGGVYSSGMSFIKSGTGGTIYGDKKADLTPEAPELQNTTGGNGHAVYVDGGSPLKRNSTAGTGIALDKSIPATGWE